MKFNTNGERVNFFGVAYNTEQAVAFDAWVLGLYQAGDLVKLQRIYTELQTHGKSHHTLRAASYVKALLVNNTAATVPRDWQRPELANLPKNLWWKLFIDKSQHGGGGSNTAKALTFDSDESPGYYNMMMRAFEDVLTNDIGNPTGFDDYDRYHVLVTAGVRRKKDNGSFEKVPHELSGRYTEFPMTRPGNYAELGAMNELIDEGTAGVARTVIERYNRVGIDSYFGRLGSLAQGRARAAAPHGYHGLAVLAVLHADPETRKMARAALRTITAEVQGTRFLSRFEMVQGPGGPGGRQMVVRTDLSESRTRTAVNGIFNRYRLEVAAAGTRDGKLAAICKTVRALHVGHFFADANGRLNTMLLLNKLLIEEGFGPTIVDDTSFFGGAKTNAQLVAMVKAGLTAFRDEVHQAHGYVPPVVVPVVPPVRRQSLDLGVRPQPVAVGRPRAASG